MKIHPPNNAWNFQVLMTQSRVENTMLNLATKAGVELSLNNLYLHAYTLISQPIWIFIKLVSN